MAELIQSSPSPPPLRFSTETHGEVSSLTPRLPNPESGRAVFDEPSFTPGSARSAGEGSSPAHSDTATGRTWVVKHYKSESPDSVQRTWVMNHYAADSATDEAPGDPDSPQSVHFGRSGSPPITPLTSNYDASRQQAPYQRVNPLPLSMQAPASERSLDSLRHSQSPSTMKRHSYSPSYAEGSGKVRTGVMFSLCLGLGFRVINQL